jgi:hypothetical protein
MLTLFLSLFVAFAVNLVLLCAGVPIRSLLLGNGILTVLITTAFSLKPYFGLGPHIDVPGWVIGLILASLLLLTSLLAVAIWRLLDVNNRKK